MRNVILYQLIVRLGILSIFLNVLLFWNLQILIKDFIGFLLNNFFISNGLFDIQ